MPPTHIYLTGFMGSGKSTIGPLLAEVLGHAYVDLDDAIEAEAGRSIPAIFASEGEAGFRAREAAALRRTGARERVVVALGGGALAQPDNLAWALAQGTVVYLRVPPATLAARLQPEAAHRPLLQDDAGRPLGADALAERVAAMLAERRAYYEQAPITVDADRAPEAVVAAIRASLSG